MLPDVIWHARVCAKSLQSRPTLCELVDDSPPGSSVHVILQARRLERISMPFYRESSNPGIKPTSLTSPTLQVGYLPLVLRREPRDLTYWWVTERLKR